MTGQRPRVVLVVGARPNFMKAAPILDVLRRRGVVESILVHTGQHYDERMSDLFFRDLGMPAPEINLGVGSGSHAQQTAEVMVRFEASLRSTRPDLVVVAGDINSTLACALVAAKEGVLLAHVESGLRSFDRGMPEELNRICTDQLADACYVTEASGMTNLAREGKAAAACLLSGNTMIDSLLRHRERARPAGAAFRAGLGLDQRGYAVCTLHRPSNVDERAALAGIAGALERAAADLPIVWPVHPRTRARLAEFQLDARIAASARIHVLPPLGYLEFLGLMDQAALVLTDSGGIQEEATVLKVPCITLRENTERPVTLEMGGNVLAGSDPARIAAAVERMRSIAPTAIGTPPLWDGRAAERIADDVERRVGAARAEQPVRSAG